MEAKQKQNNTSIKQKNKVGRPTVMTDLTVSKLEEAFALGATDEEACFFADISKQTLYDYQDKYPEFIDRKQALKQRPVLLARTSVVNGLGDPELALKYLERKKKDEFSLRQELTARDGEPIAGITDEEKVKLLKLLDDTNTKGTE
jgi:hypothetical protein